MSREIVSFQGIAERGSSAAVVPFAIHSPPFSPPGSRGCFDSSQAALALSPGVSADDRFESSGSISQWIIPTASSATPAGGS